MHVLVATDMEGIAGIDDYRDCLPSHPAAYARGRRLMTDEVLAVVGALREGGAERVTVGDWHMVGTNIERERMPRVEVLPIADLALNEAEPSLTKAAGRGRLDAVAMIGHHASTPTRLGFCSHTFIWGMEVELDGESLCETQVYAQGLAAEGIPALLASGDSRMLETFGEGELGGARLVATKEGQGRGRARSSGEPAAVREELAAAVAAALAESRRIRPVARLPGRAADRGRRPRAGEVHCLRARRAAGGGRGDVPCQPDLARVQTAGEAAAGGRRLAFARRPASRRQPPGDAGDPRQRAPLAGRGAPGLGSVGDGLQRPPRRRRLLAPLEPDGRAQRRPRAPARGRDPRRQALAAAPRPGLDPPPSPRDDRALRRPRGTGRLHVDDDVLTLEPLSAVLVEPETVRQPFNDTDADQLWLIFGTPNEVASTLEMSEETVRAMYPDGPKALPPELGGGQAPERPLAPTPIRPRPAWRRRSPGSRRSARDRGGRRAGARARQAAPAGSRSGRGRG